MVLFDQLRISDDGKRMYINVHVNTADYFENIFLESITILTSDKVLETNPGTPTDDFIYFEKFDSDMKEAALVIDIGSLNAAYNNWNPETQQPINASKPYAKVSFDKNNLSSNLFFVYIKCTEGALVGCPPCTLDELTTLGVTFDENLLYQKVMDFTKQLADDCTVPQDFTDFILLWNAFKASVETEHFVPATKYWNMLFDNRGGTPFSGGVRKNCGCHG